jgi:hypothetical protein
MTREEALISLSVLEGFAPDVCGHEVINPRTFLFGGGGGSAVEGQKIEVRRERHRKE